METDKKTGEGNDTGARTRANSVGRTYKLVKRFIFFGRGAKRKVEKHGRTRRDERTAMKNVTEITATK